MYLLTFAFLIIAMLGLYTQIYAVEVARMFANQTGIADSIIAWHEAGASLADNVINTTANPLTLAGCSLTYTMTVPAYCQKGPASTGLANVTVTGNGNYANPAGYVFPQLPSSYNTAVFQWRTIAYQPTPNTFYVVTYVPPPASPAGFISTASAPAQQLTITLGDLMHQLKVAGLPLYAYGYVTGGNLVTAANLPGGAITYPVPPTIPANSVAIISSSGHCAAC